LYCSGGTLVGDESRLRLEEPPYRLAQVVARLLGRLRHVDDFVQADVCARIAAVRLTPGLAIEVVVLPKDVKWREGGRGQDLEPALGGQRIRIGRNGGGPEGRVRFLHGLGQDTDVAHLVELALEITSLLRPRSADDL
jgi:hypothetical protein